MELNECYILLGVNKNATLTEVKKAFREKAKQYHPDKNIGKNTEELFIRITEAYEFLTNYLKNPHFQFDSFQDIIKEEKNKAQKQAEDRAKARVEYARKKYEEFTQTDFYKNDQAALIALNHVQFFILIAFITLPIIGVFNYLLNLKWLGFLLPFPAIGLFYHYYKKHVDLNLIALKNACITLLKVKEIQVTLSLLINFFLFLNYPLSTEIQFKVLLISFGILNLSCTGLSFLKRFTSFSRKKIVLVLAPSIFNLFFILNYFISFNPVVENYRFIIEQSSMIELKNNKYQHNSWFRFFVDGKKLYGKNNVTYTFKKGIFGYRILKKTELEN